MFRSLVNSCMVSEENAFAASMMSSRGFGKLPSHRSEKALITSLAVLVLISKKP